MTAGERLSRGITPEAIEQRKLAGRPITLMRWIGPVFRAAQEKGSVGVALLPGADEDKFIEAVTISAGGRKNIRKITADSEGNSTLSVRKLQQFSSEVGNNGVIVAAGLDILGDRPGGEGVRDVREYLAGLALWRRQHPQEVNNRPSIIAYGAVAVQDEARLTGGMVTTFMESDALGEGLTYSLDGHYSLDREGEIRPFYLRVFDRNISNVITTDLAVPLASDNGTEIAANGVESPPLGLVPSLR